MQWGYSHLLLEKKANLNIQGGEFGSAVEAAAFYGRTELANLLLENGAKPNTKGGRFGCALNVVKKPRVASGVREEMVRLLVHMGLKSIHQVDMSLRDGY